jgi:hypothetical protein
LSQRGPRRRIGCGATSPTHTRRLLGPPPPSPLNRACRRQRGVMGRRSPGHVPTPAGTRPASRIPPVKASSRPRASARACRRAPVRKSGSRALCRATRRGAPCTRHALATHARRYRGSATRATRSRRGDFHFQSRSRASVWSTTRRALVGARIWTRSAHEAPPASQRAAACGTRRKGHLRVSEKPSRMTRKGLTRP